MPPSAKAPRDDGAQLTISLGGGRRIAYPEATSRAATSIMRGNRSTDTRPEQVLRSILFQKGLRFRKHHPVDTDLRRVRPDVVFTRQRLAVFVDGCFWHGCPDHGKAPKSNSTYWTAKLERNRERDIATTDALRRAGWRVLRIWEHAIVEGANEVAKAVQGA